MTSANAAYFERHGDGYLPTPAGAGPWAPGSISGRPVLALCTHLFEQALPDSSWLPARLTVDMVRMTMMEPIEVHTAVRKAGRTAITVDIDLVQNGRPVALARGLGTRAEVEPDTKVWGREHSITPIPTEFLPTHPDYPMSLSGGRWVDGAGTFGAGPHGWLSPAEGPAVGWAREQGELLAGEETSDYVRLGLVADIANSVINVGETGLTFINPDITLHLSRRPEGPYIGLEALEHVHHTGTSIGSAVLHDRNGAIGLVSMTSTHQPHMPTITFRDPRSGPASSSVG